MATVSVFGLDASGKTSLLMRLSGGRRDDGRYEVLGCCHITYRTSYWLRFYDIGGDAKIRGIWGNYYADAHCFIYVVNMNDTSRLEESASLFKSVLNDPRMSNKPCLV
ncbi:P-loop containing nucleoside triphosphate hydrolase protein [Gorgonomyces haynaldii]|nr:P-loop containing nucleoside triphosphate hydrolase protein [Gorgonomyces haynaldii]